MTPVTKMALDGFHPVPISTAEMVANVFEEWVNKADISRFNIVYINTSGRQEDIIELLIPELMKNRLI